ncbi:MAG: non-specific endonuclease [Paucimonas sp.]|nr:non-specific endonuclease [Paucimonas sp.]
MRVKHVAGKRLEPTNHARPLLMIFRRFVLAVLVLACAACSKPNCDPHFADAAKPVLTNPALASRTDLLCYEGYAVMHSGASRTPLWVAEHLTSQRVEMAKTMKRKNTFHADENLSPNDRAELADYVRSGYDRGHMAPSGDMPTETAQYESFSLANMIPQHPKNNQILWEGIEDATRDLARETGSIFVITGPIFEGNSLKRLNRRVLVPTSVFKAIYDPGRQAAGAYVTRNAPGMEYQTLSIAALENRIGINLFPKMPAQIKETEMPMPTPTPHRQRGNKNAPVEVE